MKNSIPPDYHFYYDNLRKISTSIPSSKQSITTASITEETPPSTVRKVTRNRKRTPLENEALLVPTKPNTRARTGRKKKI